MRRAGEEKLVALSGETGRLIMYDDVGRRDWKHKARLPIGAAAGGRPLELHADLYDTHIDVCTPELLVLLQDNFDWQDLRRDMLPGILGQFEYLGKTMYTHVLSTDTASEYAARVHDPHTYDVVSRDIIQRWAYPLVPDANLLPDRSYRCYAHTVYKETGVTLARSASARARLRRRRRRDHRRAHHRRGERHRPRLHRRRRRQDRAAATSGRASPSRTA